MIIDARLHRALIGLEGLCKGGAWVTDLFLSYKAEDRPRVASLVQALETDGLSVWWDANIGGGDEWRDTILRHLEAARAVIVVWSRRSIGPHGQFVRDEATRALKRRTYLPVRIDKVDPPLGFGEMQALDLANWNGDRTDKRYQALLGTLRKRFGIKAARAERPEYRQSGMSRRTVVVGSAVAAASLAGTGAWLLLRPESAVANSIAVLPFANLSGDPAQAYFSDGIAEELRSALSRIAGLQVVARTSSEIMRNEDAKTASQKLGVPNILTGSVRRSASMVRVSAQLVDGNRGTERWSEIYDRAPGDALQIQTDIANRVADALSIRLGGADRKRLLQGGTNNPDAHDLLLQAQAYVERNEGQDALQRAIGMVEAALAVDPKYGDAVAIKAQMLTTNAGTYSRNALEYRQNYGQAERTARQAIELAPQSRLGYWALAEILDQQLHRRSALAQFEKMLTIPGNDARTLPTYAIFLSEIGRSADAVQSADEAIAIDPLNPRSYGMKASVLGNSRHFAKAAEVVKRHIELAPSATWPRGYHAYCQMMLGNNAQARREFDALGDRAMSAAPAYLGALAARQGDTALTEQVLGWLGSAGDGGLFQFGEIFAQLGRKDEAIGALEKAWVVRDPGLSWMKVDPLLDPVRSDPRFQALFKRLDFPT
jgi:TolB-like protein/Tfp pilus assembly protein PilF